MNLEHFLGCAVAALMLCCTVPAQPAADDPSGGTAPKAKVIKGGALKEDAPPAADGESGKKGSGAAEEKESAAGKETSNFKIEGDTVHLKSGKSLRGVKVLRVTPSTVELQYDPGQPPMKIPYKLVTNIEYENPSNSPQTPAAGPKKEGGDVMVAEEISADFNKKLTAPLPDTPAEFKDQDALAVLKNLADRVQVVVTVDPEAEKVPEAQRKVTLSVAKNATLSTLLREGFKTAVPALKFSLQFDKILVTSAEAEARKAEAPVPPGLAPKKEAAPPPAEGGAAGK